VLLIHVFETKFLEHYSQDIQRPYRIIKRTTPVILMAVGGVELLLASVYVPSIPPPSLSLNDPNYVKMYWVVALTLLAGRVLDDLLHKDISVPGVKDAPLRRLVEDTKSLACLAFVLSTNCTQLAFWLVIAKTMEHFLLGTVCQSVQSNRLRNFTVVVARFPVAWRLCQIARQFSMSWDGGSLGAIVAAIALVLLLLRQSIVMYAVVVKQDTMSYINEKTD